MRTLDNIDLQILNALSCNSRTPLKKLSEKVHLSSPAVSARIERLEEEGYITGYSTILNYEKLGQPITAFIELTVEPDMRASFNNFVASKSCVLECYHVAGVYSMLLKACFPTPSKLNEFIGILQSFGKTETQIVFSCVVPPRNMIFPKKDMT